MPHRVLLDTHVLLWSRWQPERLSTRARELLEDGASELLWSAASTWELAIKSRLGKLELNEPLSAYVARVIREMGLVPLAIEHPHAWENAALPLHHRDPFDRMLVAQSRLERSPILSNDVQFDSYSIERIW